MLHQGYRASDAVITICQDNERKLVEIRDINRPAEGVLGYGAQSVSGKPLAGFLPKRIQALLHEYVEFEPEGNDVGNVLSKVQSFCMLDSKGKEAAFRLKVVRIESPDGRAHFRLILQGKTPDRKEEAFRSLLRENFKGHEVLEPNTELADRNSLVKNIELTHYYVVKEALHASVALLALDNYDALAAQHGAGVCYGMLKHIAQLAKQNLRGDDTVGCPAPSSLALILLDTTPESARMVLNRLRWLVAANPYADAKGNNVPLTVSIAHVSMEAEVTVKDLLPRLEAQLAASGGGNALTQMQA